MNGRLRLVQRCFLSSVVLAAVALPAVAGNLTVIVRPWGPSQVTTFDPAHPPTDPNGKPLVPANEAAVAIAVVDQHPPTVATSSPGPGGEVTVTHIDVEVSGHTQILLPNNAPQQLIDHETGHDALFGAEYALYAERKLTEAVRALVGRSFPSVEAAQAEVKKALETRGLASLELQLSGSGDYYDWLTDHGRNTKPDSATAVRDTSEMFEIIRRWADDYTDPSDVRHNGDGYPYEIGIVDPISVRFDAELNTLNFGGDALVDYVGLPGDAILGRGRISIGPIVWIGSRDDGTIDLSDAGIRIVDAVTGDVLLDSLLLDVRYVPSGDGNLPGRLFAGLAIPPDFAAGGIDNTIHSTFLAAIGDPLTTGYLTVMEFDPKRRLFDNEGNVDIPALGVSGRMVLKSVPEPSSVLLLACGLIAMAIRTTRRRRP